MIRDLANPISAPYTKINKFDVKGPHHPLFFPVSPCCYTHNLCFNTKSVGNGKCGVLKKEAKKELPHKVPEANVARTRVSARRLHLQNGQLG